MGWGIGGVGTVGGLVLFGEPAERIAMMENNRTWEDGDNVYGLPKTKVPKIKKGGKKKKKKKDEEA